MLLKELLREAGLPPAGINAVITGITDDSRRVKAGNLFVAVRGLKCDGHTYIDEAIRRGAVFVISERPLSGVPHLVVQNVRDALSYLFDAWYGHPAREMSLIGVTGTNGKTSVSAMLFAILRHAGYSCGLIGTVECRCNDEVLSAAPADGLANMTTPDPAALYFLLAEMRRRGARFVVMEVTSHALALGRVAPLRFRRAVFTNLTPDHLDLHGDMESYFLEKKKLFGMAESAVISCSTDYGTRLCEGLEIPFYPVSKETLSNVQKKGSDGVSFRLACDNLPATDIFLPVPGDFSVENGALATATALSLGISPDAVRTALCAFDGVRGRIERVGKNPFGISVFLDYAHTPDALEKLLLTVRGFRLEGQRIFLLFGCGGDRDRTKRAAMGRVASRLADFLILTSDNCRTERAEDILRDILKGVDKEKPHIVIPDRRTAIAYAISEAKQGDIVLLAGKGHEEYEIQGSKRLPFSEREIVRECFARRGEGEQYEN